MDESGILLERPTEGIVRVTLNRPARRNAFDGPLMAELKDALEAIGREDGVRLLVLAGRGKSFSAGADLDWMRQVAGFSKEENRADAQRLEALMTTLDTLPIPVIARVQGAAIGGGIGLVAACDMAVAAETAVFALSEVRLGIVPAVIAPLVVRAIGERQARRYMLSGERFDAATAQRLGLVHEVVPEAELDGRLEAVGRELLKAGPEAVRHAKRLLRELRGPDPVDLPGLIATLRASAEGQEGIGAFLEKRPPTWTDPG